MRRGIFVLMAGLAFGACTDSYEYDAPVVEDAGIYLSAVQTDYLFSADDEQTISFTVARRDSVQAHTYHLTTSDPSLGIPTEVFFAAGEARKTISVTCNLPMPTYDHIVTVAPAEGEAYIYGNPNIDLSLTLARKLVGSVLIYPMYYDERQREIYEMGTRQIGNRKVATYMVKDMYSDGYNVRLTVDDGGFATIANQPALLYSVSLGSDDYLHYIEGTGAYNSLRNALEFTLTFTVDGFGYFQSGIASEVLYFPNGYNPVPTI